MDTRMYFIPLIMFVLAMAGFAVMLVMGKRAKKSVGKAKETMADFVREQLFSYMKALRQQLSY